MPRWLIREKGARELKKPIAKDVDSNTLIRYIAQLPTIPKYLVDGLNLDL